LGWDAIGRLWMRFLLDGSFEMFKVVWDDFAKWQVHAQMSLNRRIWWDIVTYVGVSIY
jgi:hypothetical protein